LKTCPLYILEVLSALIGVSSAIIGVSKK